MVVIDDLIELGFGSYESLINLTLRDISEIKKVRESKIQEAQVSRALS